tara:strand:+ start:703 stop:1290 length:588 start_codon:yes stop_codon:yes gene_type:complete
MKSINICVILVIFLLGLYFYVTPNRELFVNPPRCPDLLIQKGEQIHLLNTKLARVPGVNPLTFQNLDEYTEFVKWQRSNNINCPVLYLQHTYNVQGNSEYKVFDNPASFQPCGLTPEPVPGYVPRKPDLLVDATRNDPPYNNNSYPGYDQDNQYIGKDTPLDKMYHSNPGKPSLNPMDDNWVGEKKAKKEVNVKK